LALKKGETTNELNCISDTLEDGSGQHLGDKAEALSECGALGQKK